MSPLASSLFVFAALLAATTALTLPDPYCGELNLGLRTDDSRYFELKGTGGSYVIPDQCAPGGAVGSERVGQNVVVCNKPNSKPEIIQIGDLDPFHEVWVECPNNTYGCEDVTVQVTQFCDVVGPKGQ